MEVDGEETKPALDESPSNDSSPLAEPPLAARGAHAPHGEGGSDTDDSLDTSMESSRGGEHGGVGANLHIDAAGARGDAHEISLTRRTRPPSIRIAGTPLGPLSGPRQWSPIAEGDEEVPPCASA